MSAATGKSGGKEVTPAGQASQPSSAAAPTSPASNRSEASSAGSAAAPGADAYERMLATLAAEAAAPDVAADARFQGVLALLAAAPAAGPARTNFARSLVGARGGHIPGATCGLVWLCQKLKKV